MESAPKLDGRETGKCFHGTPKNSGRSCEECLAEDRADVNATFPRDTGDVEPEISQTPREERPEVVVSQEGDETESERQRSFRERIAEVNPELAEKLRPREEDGKGAKQ